MAKKKVNIGGYDQNAFYDCLGVNYLEWKLLETGLIMPEFNKMDKYPNLDGSFEVCEMESPVDSQLALAEEQSSQWRVIPKCTFDVQIKTLNADYVNHNKNARSEHTEFKYSCDTKAMNYVLKSGTLNPVLLLFVDWKHERIFWKYLSQEYCLQLGLGKRNKKVIYFNRSDEIVDMQEWIRELRTIHTKLVQKSRDEKELCFTTNIVVGNRIQKDILNEMQEAFDYINGLYEHELKFVRDILFPDVWKFGIAYVKKDKTDLSYAGIYKIKQGENQNFFKSFEEEAWGGYLQKTHFGGLSLKEIITDGIERHIKLLFNKKEIVSHIMPDRVLLELFYREIDKVLFGKQTEMIADEQQGEIIDIGWAKDIMNISEYRQLEENGDVNEIAGACAEELISRGLTEFDRPFAYIARHIIHIDEKMEEDTGCCISYEPDYDREALRRKNMMRFFDDVASLYKEGRRLIGNPDAISWKVHSACWVLDDFSQIYIETMEAEAFQFDWKLVSKEAFKKIWKKRMDVKDQGTKQRWFVLNHEVYSWNRLWRAMFQGMALNVIGKEKDMKSLYWEQ